MSHYPGRCFYLRLSQSSLSLLWQSPQALLLGSTGFGIDAERFLPRLGIRMSDMKQDILKDLGLSEDHFIQRGLPQYSDAEVLMAVQTDEDGRVHELVPEACEAWHAMKAAAMADGHEIFIVSAFRSIARQSEIVAAKHRAGQEADAIFSVSAPPGFSEHHTGRAVDVSTPGYQVLEEEFEQSPAFAWLVENAGGFGFRMTYPRGNDYGFIYEPWHWAYMD